MSLSQNEVNARIERLLGQRGEFPVTIRQGQTPLAPPNVAGPNGVDATERFDPAQANAADKAQREADAVRKAQVQEIVRPSNEPREVDVVQIGTLRLYPQPLDPNSWEAKFTKGGYDPFVFEQDGERLTSAEGIRMLYESLKAQTGKGK